jgi:anti-sigma factor ChrR (cupin superfamily)
MSHVDDGALHAFLDGALEALPPEEAARIRDHLAACPSCAARLEEERSIRAEASTILADAMPALDGLPTFEELRAQAAARGPSQADRSSGRLQKMAWAASIVLALGAGWMLRQATAPSGALQRALEGSRAPGAVAVPILELERARDASTGEELAEAEAAAPPAARTEAEARTTDGRGIEEPVVEQELSSDATAERASLPAEAKVRPTRRTDSAGARPSSAMVFNDSLGKATDDRAAAEVRGALAQEFARRTRPAARDEVLVAPASPMAQVASVAPGPPELDETGSLVVPGLVVLSVSWLDEGGLAGVVRVRQLLEGGDTLELLHLPSGIDPSALGTLASDGRTELVVPRDGGWLLARAHTTGDTLRALVDRLLASR